MLEPTLTPVPPTSPGIQDVQSGPLGPRCHTDIPRALTSSQLAARLQARRRRRVAGHQGSSDAADWAAGLAMALNRPALNRDPWPCADGVEKGDEVLYFGALRTLPIYTISRSIFADGRLGRPGILGGVTMLIWPKLRNPTADALILLRIPPPDYLYESNPQQLNGRQDQTCLGTTQL